MSGHKIAYWRGKPVDELSREELIDALNAMARMNEKMRKDHTHDLEVIAGIRLALA